MYLFEGQVVEFARLATTEELVNQLSARFREVHLHQAGESEVNSWRLSLRELAQILVTAAPDAAVVLEYMLPLNSKRLDAVVLGRDEAGVAHAVVVELKQWEAADIEDAEDGLVTVGGRILLHPQQQLLQYVR